MGTHLGEWVLCSCQQSCQHLSKGRKGMSPDQVYRRVGLLWVF